MRLTTDLIAYTVVEHPAVEPDQHLQLPPAGGRRDAGAGDRVRDVDRDRGARRGARRRPGAAGAVRRRGGADLVLRQRRRAVRRGDVQDARASSRSGTRLTRDRYGVTDPKAAPAPVRRAGELARPHRGAAREQRAAHRARDARRHAVPRRPGPGRAAAGLERGARAAPAVGPAVVAADAAGAGLRVRPARVRRPLRRLARGRGQGRRAASTAARAEMARIAGDGRRGGRGRERLPQVRAGRLALAAPGPGRVRRGGRRRGEPVHRDRAEPADRRPRDRRSRPSTRRSRPRPSAALQALAGRPGRGRGRGGARPRCGTAASHRAT